MLFVLARCQSVWAVLASTPAPLPGLPLCCSFESAQALCTACRCLTFGPWHAHEHVMMVLSATYVVDTYDSCGLLCPTPSGVMKVDGDPEPLVGTRGWGPCDSGYGHYLRHAHKH